MAVRSFSCRIKTDGSVTLPAALVKGLAQQGTTCLSAGFADGHVVLQPLDRDGAAIARLAPLLALLDADFASAEALSARHFGISAAGPQGRQAKPAHDSPALDTPVLGPVGL